MRSHSRPSWLGIVAMLSASAVGDVRLPAILSDHMVLQHGETVRLWGWAEPGERVRVAWSVDDQRVECESDPRGRWEVFLRTPQIVGGPLGANAGPHTITFSAANEVVIHDVLLGEVWLASGQSNMQMTLGPSAFGVHDWQREVRQADWPAMRFFQVERRVSPAPLEDCEGSWVVCSPTTAPDLSAVAYFFARSIHLAQRAPVGMIVSAWGGTVAEAWTSAEGLREFPEFRNDLMLAARLARNPGQIDEQLARARRQWWERVEKDDPGSRDGAFALIDADESQWGSIALPTLWESTPGLENFDGFAWFRRRFDAPADLPRKDLALTLGPIDDMDTVWVNGVRVGATEDPGRWQQPRSYTIPAGLLRATGNVIAVRVLDTGGAGGFAGSPDQMAISGAPALRVSLAGEWRFHRGLDARSLAPMPSTLAFHQNSPTALSNAMIEPIAPMTIRGAIWYQGESNRTRARQYRALLPALIQDWRRRFGRDLPFGIVQIAPFAYAGDTGEAAELREAQRMALDALEGVGLAVTMDLGDAGDIHPKEKKEVGRRLALWALAEVYGHDVVYRGPSVRDVTFERNLARLTFDNGEGGLRLAPGARAQVFELAGADGVYHPCDGLQIMPDGAVLAMCSVVESPVSVRYAWGAADAGVLHNASALPASSFRWPIQ